MTNIKSFQDHATKAIKISPRVQNKLRTFRAHKYEPYSEVVQRIIMEIERRKTPQQIRVMHLNPKVQERINRKKNGNTKASTVTVAARSRTRSKDTVTEEPMFASSTQTS